VNGDHVASCSGLAAIRSASNWGCRLFIVSTSVRGKSLLTAVLLVFFLNTVQYLCSTSSTVAGVQATCPAVDERVRRSTSSISSGAGSIDNSQTADIYLQSSDPRSDSRSTTYPRATPLNDRLVLLPVVI